MNYEATIITTCKGRKEHLHQTIDSMLTQEDVNHEVVIVDYGDPDNVWDLFMFSDTMYRRKNSNLRSVKVVDNTDFFNHSRARNFGAAVADSPILAFVDADVTVDRQWLRTCVDLLEHSSGLVVRSGNTQGKTGTCVVTADMFKAASGYDEEMVGWGHEDIDFYRRCEQHGKKVFYDSELVAAIEHSDWERTRFCSIDMKTSTANNRARLSMTARKINSKGYALGAAIYFSKYADSLKIVREPNA